MTRCSSSCFLALVLVLGGSLTRADDSGDLGVVLGQLPDRVAGPEGAIVYDIVRDGQSVDLTAKLN